MSARKLSLFPTTTTNPRLDPLLVERIRVFYARLAAELRELEKYKTKRGICTAGISCTKPATKGRACAHHAAATKAGIRLRRWEAYITEYGLLRQRERMRTSRPKRTKNTKTKKEAA